MTSVLRQLLQPMNLAGLCTLLAVALSLRWVPAGDAVLAWSVLVVFTVLFLGHDAVAKRARWLGHGLLALLPLLALTLVWLSPGVGTAQVLLVIWTAVIAMTWPPRVALAAVVLADIVIYLILQRSGHNAPLTVTLLYAGFQAFAALVAHYAMTAERSRDQLALVNADLLATRALLADSARDGERLRLARELHDVAGHKLTALTLNLRALAGDPALAGRTELGVAERMAAELMGDIRGVVQAIRDNRGLDLATALHALAAPLPRPRLQLSLDERLRMDDPERAQLLLRVVQEALTNAARHGDAAVLRVDLTCDTRRGGLQLRLADDGRLRAPLREGNGLAGMRERVEGAGGEFNVRPGDAGGVCIDVWLPA
ncbi:sensor histidine kinase [Lysobacter sp. A3-1-A15]|uniref:sensor histidine kinase n=1 Tax=Novilysobacter viscosus TaxID=3098602 RepID=UPI002EDB2E3E